MKVFSFLIKIINMLMMVLLLISCKNVVSKEEVLTLNLSIENKWNSNLKNMRNILYEIEEMGGRHLDFVLWKDIQDMIKLRKLYRIPEAIDSIDSQLKLNAALTYLMELKQLSILKQVEYEIDYVDRVMKINENPNIKVLIKRRLILVNVLEMEGYFIEDRAIRLGVNCMVICPKINYFRESDTVQVGDKFESIIGLSDQGNSFEMFNMRNVELTKDEKSIPVTYTEISGSLYMYFKVEDEGVYHYTGELLVSYDSLETGYSCDFEYLITAIK